jgi:hypothetical protein
MSEDMRAELQHWQARTDEMQVALERVREQRDEWEATAKTQAILLDQQEREIRQLGSMLERIQVAMSQGQEL